MQQSTRNRALTTNVWTDLEDLQHVIDTVVGAHLETCEFTRDRVREMKLRAKDCPNYTEPTRVSWFEFFVFDVNSYMTCQTTKVKAPIEGQLSQPSQIWEPLPDARSLPSSHFVACRRKKRAREEKIAEKYLNLNFSFPHFVIFVALVAVLACLCWWHLWNCELIEGQLWHIWSMWTNTS